jgi:ParB-like chromosome segregation protein Spo0J
VDVVELPLPKLLRAEWNANRVDEETLVKIRRSIEQFGVVENLVVRKHPAKRGCFEVLSGNHRRDLYEQAGMTLAPCVVVDVDDARARLLAQTLNRTRGADDPLAYRELLEDVLGTMSVDEVLELLPETSASLDRILGPPGDVHEDFDSFQVWGIVVELDDEDAQVELLARLQKEGMKCRALMS